MWSPGLKRLGFDTIGQLAAVPRAPLVRRFGMDVTRRLDQVSGAAAEPLDPIEPPDMPQVKLGFIEPIGTPEHLARAIFADLADLLCVRLRGRGGSGRGGSISPCPRRWPRRDHPRRHGGAEPRAAASGAPAHRAVRHRRSRLWRRDHDALRAALAGAARHRADRGGALPTQRRGDIALLVDTLANRLGAHRLYRAAPVESDIPERAVRTVAPLAPTRKAAWPAELPRPVRLLDPPEEVQTMAPMPDHPPRHFIWRGRRHHVTHADGPERVFGEWWRREAETATVRDYFAVEDEAGARFWLFRSWRRQRSRQPARTAGSCTGCLT